MRRIIGSALVVALLGVLPAAATENKKEVSESSAAAHHASGTLTKWDEASKSFAVKSMAGEKSFTWGDSTKITGAPKIGEKVYVEYAKGKDGVISVTAISTSKHPSSRAEKK